MSSLHYAVLECWGDEFEDAVPVPRVEPWNERDLEYIAERAAEDFYHSRDGWDSWDADTWKVFVIFCDEKEIGRVDVSLEFMPEFRGRKL